MSESPIDPDLSRWILEFLFHQDIEYPLLNSLVSVLPIPPQNLTLSKLFLLQKLQFQVTNCKISENVLDLFDKIYELDKYLGSESCSEYLRKAFCAVAVECSVGCLRNRASDVRGEFFEVVKRLWRGRVRVMEEGNVGLVSEELLEWRDDIEAAVWEENVCRRVIERSNGIDVVEAVRVYVKDEKSRMGPSFLELVSETLENSRRRDGGDQRIDDGEFPGFGDGGSPCDKGKSVAVDGGKRDLLGKRKRAAYKHPRPITSGSCRGVKIVDVEEAGTSQSCRTPEVERVPEALNKVIESGGDQNLELPRGQDIGKSSEEIGEKAQSDEADLGVEDMGIKPTEDRDRANSPVVDNAVDVESGEANACNANCCGKSNAPKSLMERNKTACTLEWNDSIDREPSDSILRPHLPSPREGRVLPSNMFQEQNPRPQRNRRWSVVEEETLRAGVAKFGQGYWKLILNAYRDIFVGRSYVDLKDKWRNMTRPG